MSIQSRNYGVTKDGHPVKAFTLTDSDGSFVEIINYGCAVTKICVPDKEGILTDVTLGYDTVEEYERSKTYFGTICGRCSNRIADGKFTLNGVEYTLYVNDGPNSLHGGKEGFCFKLWDAEIAGDSVVMSYVSQDMEEGYPGCLKTSVTFTYRDHRLGIDCEFSSDKDTIANIINHSYFNLNGHDNGNILNHTLMLNAAEFCEDDDYVMPYRKPISVAGTPFDFREAKAIGKELFDSNEQLKKGRGYDHNWVLSGEHAASAVGDKSGITLDVYTDLPGIQFYSGNVIGTVNGKGGCTYSNYSGFCLETQQFPNAINVPEYPSVVLKAGETHTCHTEYVFGI